MYAGIKFFIIDFIFKSCPKLRQRYDTPYIIWTNLPTDLQLKERSNAQLSRRVSPNSQIHSQIQLPGSRTGMKSVRVLYSLYLSYKTLESRFIVLTAAHIASTHWISVSLLLSLLSCCVFLSQLSECEQVGSAVCVRVCVCVIF